MRSNVNCVKNVVCPFASFCLWICSFSHVWHLCEVVEVRAHDTKQMCDRLASSHGPPRRPPVVYLLLLGGRHDVPTYDSGIAQALGCAPYLNHLSQNDYGMCLVGTPGTPRTPGTHTRHTRHARHTRQARHARHTRHTRHTKHTRGMQRIRTYPGGEGGDHGTWGLDHIW